MKVGPILLMQATSLLLTSTKMRMLFGLWLLMLVVLQQGYLSLILAILKAPNREPPIDSLHDLTEAIRHRGYKWTAVYGSETYTAILDPGFNDSRKSDVLELRKLSHYLDCSPNECETPVFKYPSDEYYYNLTELLSFIQRNNIVYVNYKKFAERATIAHGNVYQVSKTSYHTVFASYFVPRGSPVLTFVNKVLSMMIEADLFEHEPVQCVKKMFDPFPPDDYPKTDDYEVIALMPLFYTFVSLIIGWVVSVFAFIGELAYKRYQQRTPVEPFIYDDNQEKNFPSDRQQESEGQPSTSAQVNQGHADPVSNSNTNESRWELSFTKINGKKTSLQSDNKSLNAIDAFSKLNVRLVSGPRMSVLEMQDFPSDKQQESEGEQSTSVLANQIHIDPVCNSITDHKNLKSFHKPNVHSVPGPRKAVFGMCNRLEQARSSPPSIVIEVVPKPETRSASGSQVGAIDDQNQKPELTGTLSASADIDNDPQPDTRLAIWTTSTNK